jgi:hypothetical protein
MDVKDLKKKPREFQIYITFQSMNFKQCKCVAMDEKKIVM